MCMLRLRKRKSKVPPKGKNGEAKIQSICMKGYERKRKDKRMATNK